MTREELMKAQAEGTWLVQTPGLTTPVLVRADAVDMYLDVDWWLDEFRPATPNDMLKYDTSELIPANAERVYSGGIVNSVKFAVVHRLYEGSFAHPGFWCAVSWYAQASDGSEWGCSADDVSVCDSTKRDSAFKDVRADAIKCLSEAFFPDGSQKPVEELRKE